MANKREFKKYVNVVSTSLVEDMMSVYYSINGVDPEKIDDAIISVLKAGESAIMKTNVKFDKTAGGFENRHLYDAAKKSFYAELYKKISKEFSEAINEAIKKFNAAVPQEVRNQLKTAAASATD